MKSKKNLSHIRASYDKSSLHKSDLDSDPFRQFNKWFEAAVHHTPLEVNAMTLATSNSQGMPSLRVVLLKGVEEGGFVFYTNYESRKGKQMEENPNAALLFYWPMMEQQVRIEGTVSRVRDELSVAYFQSRPIGSQMGAWASPQSQVIPGREVLTEKIEALTKTYEGKQILPKPPYWGGYVLKPNYFEFWQGRSNRLHDRFSYKPTEQDSSIWNIERLAP